MNFSDALLKVMLIPFFSRSIKCDHLAAVTGVGLVKVSKLVKVFVKHTKCDILRKTVFFCIIKPTSTVSLTPDVIQSPEIEELSKKF